MTEQNKYARIVFEKEIPKDESEEEILDIMKNAIHDFIGDHWGIDDVEIHDRPYIADECNNDVKKTPENCYELWEVDLATGKCHKKVDEKDNIEEARKRAKELAKAWCEDEEPEQCLWGENIEVWVGNSDFGIAIIKKSNVDEK